MTTLRKFSLWLALGSLLLRPGGALRADDSADAAEAHMREALRSTMLQLRDAQNQLAAAQTAQAEGDQKNKALTDQVGLLKKHAADDKAAADKTIADLQAKVSDQSGEIARLKDAVDKWKAACAQATAVAQAEQTQRAKLQDDDVVMQRRVSYLETRNVALFKLGNEILNRYEDFSLGKALAAREPFIGVTRTKLENQIQDYQDKLLDQKAQP
ncbi:MAG TPA: phage major capsid protein [Opitutaceae bacterium]|nr:phage major capsid protein [Opitutaceae bacterium]